MKVLPPDEKGMLPKIDLTFEPIFLKNERIVQMVTMLKRKIYQNPEDIQDEAQGL